MKTKKIANNTMRVCKDNGTVVIGKVLNAV